MLEGRVLHVNQCWLLLGMLLLQTGIVSGGCGASVDFCRHGLGALVTLRSGLTMKS